MDILEPDPAIVFSDTDEVDKLVAAQSAQELYDLQNLLEHFFFYMAQTRSG